MLVIHFLVVLCVPAVLATPLHTRQATDSGAASPSNDPSGNSADEFAAALAELQRTYQLIEDENNQLQALKALEDQQKQTSSEVRQVRGSKFAE